MIRKLIILGALLCFAPILVSAQGFRIGDANTVQSSLNSPGTVSVLPATVAICISPANAVPCTNKATTFTSVTLGVSCPTSTQVVLAGTSTCVSGTDTRGNWGAWVGAGTYDITFTIPSGLSFGPYTVSAGVPAGTNLTLGVVTIPALTQGNCVQAGSGGTLTTTGSFAPCAMASVAAESFGAQPSQTAANNFNFIQQALNNCTSTGSEATLLTPGTFLITGTLTIGSNCRFRLGQQTRIKVVTGGQGVPVLQNTGFLNRASTTSITVTWTSGMTFSVGFTAHGLTCLNGGFPCTPLNPTYIWINGANQPQFDGVFLVQSLTDANNFVVSAIRQPTTAATGTITGRFTDKDITVEGGIWDYNFPNNTVPTNTFASSAFQFAIVNNLTIRNVKINNVQKYAINTNITRGLNIDGYASDFTASDGIHVFGPAYNTRISHIDGHNGDDFVILDPTTDPNFPGFQIATTGGDVINAILENITGENTGAGCVALYGPYGGFVMTNITVRNIHCIARNAFVVNIAAGILYPSPAQFGTITLDHISGARDGGGQLVNIGGQSADIDTQIQTLTISNMETDAGDVSTFSSLVNSNHFTHIEHLSLLNHVVNPAAWANGGGHYAWTLDGSFGVVDVDGTVFAPAPTVFPPQARVFTFLGQFLGASATSSSQVGTLETVTTSAAHGFTSGIWVTQSGSGVAACNGFFQVQRVPSTTTYTFNTTAASGNCGAMTAIPTTVEKLNLRNNRFNYCGQINGLLTMANPVILTMTDNIINCSAAIVFTGPTTVWAQNNILNGVTGGLVQGGANTTITLNSLGNTLNGGSTLFQSGGFTVTQNGITCEGINIGCQFRSPVSNLFPFGNLNMQGVNSQITTPFIQAGEIAANSTLAGLSGTGICTTLASQSGGQNAGQVTCNGTTGVSTLVITPGQTAPHGWSCSGSSSSPALALAQLGPFNTTTCTLSSGTTSLNSGSIITFGPVVAW